MAQYPGDPLVPGNTSWAPVWYGQGNTGGNFDTATSISAPASYQNPNAYWAPGGAYGSLVAAPQGFTLPAGASSGGQYFTGQGYELTPEQAGGLQTATSYPAATLQDSLNSNMGFGDMSFFGPLMAILGPFAALGGLGALGGAAAGGGMADPFAGGFTGDIGADALSSGSFASPAAASAAGYTPTGGIQQLIQQLQQVPGGSQIAQAIVQQLTGGGGGSGPGGSPSGTGLGLGSLLPLLGIGSGLNTMFGSKPAVDPAMLQALWQAGQQTYQTSLDPQRALYAQTAQQIQDQSRAADSARGIGMGGVSAGNENDAMRKFNIDWQNAQLGRQVQGTDAFARAGGVGAQSGIANAAQQFAQNQTGLNNLTTGLGGLFGGTGSPGAGTMVGAAGGGQNPIGSWLNSLFTGGAQGGGVSYNPFPSSGAGTFDPSSSYNAQGTFQPFYTGTDFSGGPAYG